MLAAASASARVRRVNYTVDVLTRLKHCLQLLPDLARLVVAYLPPGDDLYWLEEELFCLTMDVSIRHLLSAQIQQSTLPLIVRFRDFVRRCSKLITITQYLQLTDECNRGACYFSYDRSCSCDDPLTYIAIKLQYERHAAAAAMKFRRGRIETSQ